MNAASSLARSAVRPTRHTLSIAAADPRTAAAAALAACADVCSSRPIRCARVDIAFGTTMAQRCVKVQDRQGAFALSPMSALRRVPLGPAVLDAVAESS